MAPRERSAAGADRVTPGVNAAARRSRARRRRASAETSSARAPAARSASSACTPTRATARDSTRSRGGSARTRRFSHSTPGSSLRTRRCRRPAASSYGLIAASPTKISFQSGPYLCRMSQRRDALVAAAAVVAPDVVVDAVVEVEVLEVAELALRRREQLLADAHVRVHRAADVEEQQHLDPVAPLGQHVQVEPAGVARRALDRAVEVELLGHAFAREAAQLAAARP